MKKIGWIGLGNMGLPMAHNLEKANFPLAVYNRSIQKTTSFNGTNATICNSIAELVEQSDLIFTMLTNDEAVTEVYNTIFSLTIAGKIFVDMSTVSQELSESIAQKTQEKDASFLDAPVAGSTQPAKDGTLIIMVGGAETTLSIALPYLQKLGKLVKHLGTNGKGIAAKLSINYFLSILYQGLAESVLLAEKNGIDRSDYLEIINESAAGSGATKVKTPLLIKEDYPPAFALSLMLKDVLLAQKNGAAYPLTSAIIETYTEAAKSTAEQKDVISIIDYLKKFY